MVNPGRQNGTYGVVRRGLTLKRPVAGRSSGRWWCTSARDAGAMPSSWPWARLARHDDLIERLATAVASSPQLRWLEICCSLAAGRADEWSDVDAGVGYSEDADGAAVEAIGVAVVSSLAPVVEMLIHVIPAWSPETRRFAVEFENELQLDLVLMPASRRTGVPTGAVALVDKDARLTSPWQPPVEGPPAAEEAREWLMLGWWALSDTAKYVARGSLFEAVDRMADARQQALKLYAAGQQVPFPSFGLVSLLDFPPYEVPEQLSRTYATPSGAVEVVAAAEAVADLLEQAAQAAGNALNAEIATSWRSIARRRLERAVQP